MRTIEPETLDALAGALDAVLNGDDCAPDKRELGFALMVFRFNRSGPAEFITSGDRDMLVAALRETAARLERREDAPAHPRRHHDRH